MTSSRGREKRMRSLGLSRYRSKQAVAQGQTAATLGAPVLPTHFGPERCLMSEIAAAMIKRMHALRERGRKGEAGFHSRTLLLLDAIPIDAACVIAARVAIDGMAQGKYYQPLAAMIGGVLREEAMLRALRGTDRTAFLNLQRKYAKNKTHNRKASAQRRKAIKLAIEIFKLGDWPHPDQVRAGMFMLELLRETGLIQFRVAANPSGKKFSKIKYVEPVPSVAEWLKAAHELQAAAKPFWLPLDVPPKNWRSINDGGYWTDELPRLTLVKEGDEEILNGNSPEHCPEVYQAVNTLQRVPFTINKRIYDTAVSLWDRNADLPCLPLRTDLPVPEKPADAEKGSEALRQWRKAAAKAHQRNRDGQSFRIQTARTLMVAKEMGDKHFYYPYQLDFRGRAYAVPVFLTPQGDDLARGLLQFHHGVPVDAQGERWMLRNLANTYGYDKASWEDRERWALENESRILQAAQHPTTDRWWADADKPWQFLAACMEWNDRKVLGEKFLSKQPISLDGSNNGLQLFSLMLRDQYGAEATNCAPSPVPQDIYQRVADEVKRTLLESYEHPMSKAWLDFWGGQIPRALVKRSVMVLPYGASIYTSQKYVSDYYADYVYTQRIQPIAEDSYRYLLYLNSMVWAAINKIVTGAQLAMDWLHQVADLCTNENKAVRWRSPTGFFVKHQYFDTRSMTVKTVVGDKMLSAKIRTSTKTLNRKKQRSALSPNFVHALDAAVLVKAVNRLADAGVSSIVCVHDSFGVPVSQLSQLTEALAESALEIFSKNVLESFAEQVKMQLTHEADAVPALPQQGEFDITTLKDSKYFFS